MSNAFWIILALVVAVLTGDTALFMGMMKWALMLGLLLGGIVFVVNMVRAPFTRR